MFISLYFGVACGHEVLVSLSAGAQHYKYIQVLINKTILLMVVLFLPIFGIIYFSNHIFLIINVDPEVIEHAYNFSFHSCVIILFAGIGFVIRCKKN